MPTQAHRDMLTQQYLDNWAYQANIRKDIYRMQDSIRTDNVRYTGTLNEKLESYMGERVQDFAEKYLKIDPRTVSARFPWGRLFETDITVYDQPIAPLQKNYVYSVKRKPRLKRKPKQEPRPRRKPKLKQQPPAMQPRQHLLRVACPLKFR